VVTGLPAARGELADGAEAAARTHRQPPDEGLGSRPSEQRGQTAAPIVRVGGDSRPGSGPDPRSARVLTEAVDPALQLLRIEAQQVPPLDEGNAALVHQAAHVAHLDAEVFSNLG